MQAPQALVNILRQFDRHIRVRWSDALCKFAIDRRHGIAGNNKDVLKYMHSIWASLDDELREMPWDVELDGRVRVAWDEFIARRSGYQVILYLSPKALNWPNLVVDELAQVDIRRHGGAFGYWKKQLEERARQERIDRARNDEILADKLEEGYDRQKAGKKDWYAGGEIFDYQIPVRHTPRPKHGRTPSVVETEVID
ncbi:hypothetical protein LCGC14_1294010 [marine sediment metagenome]|uniref:Uncharacterized protein n=1 Tax=marine sediment metagenome TaxID=412755 RepID=A0A0F9N847_9ZZZZ